MVKTLILVLACFQLMACGPVLLKPVQYQGDVVVKSDLPATVGFNTGAIKGYSSTLTPLGAIFVPVSSGAIPRLQFGEADQQSFVTSLKSELLRLGLVGSIVETGPDALIVVVNFVQTEHFRDFQEYKIIASVETAYGDRNAAFRYEVLSSDGDSAWAKMNTDASEGKQKAATKLLARIIPDIQGFVATLRK